ncbi:hypothetical protein SKAU_G00022230 [Synaphobranchus kaupii]|uniref:Uncharacterized protein n=1 Tax=Synaphobranchus kaupii TaxID=118154 RepID=A0A9Q1GDB7_SYNKA|nr:hypothetical protein SKAU_G00022230 [Synaphobranchus kaupii]
MEPPASDTPASGAEKTETIRGRGSMIKDRGEWANKTEFRLAMAGAIIGLGNMWRFTTMTYANGGARLQSLPLLTPSSRRVQAQTHRALKQTRPLHRVSLRSLSVMPRGGVLP